MKKLLLKKCINKGHPGYDLRIKNKNLNVQDLLTELNDFIGSGRVERVWPGDRSSCCACDLCCYEPLPVTSIDVENICRAKNIEFMEAFKYLWVEVQGNVVDITLRRARGGRCIFLTRDKTCSIYQYRPFACQAYICCSTTEKTEELKSQIVNQGMDELVRKAISEFKALGLDLPVNKGKKTAVNITDWSENCFTGKKNYSEVLLKDLLSPDLMKVLLL